MFKERFYSSFRRQTLNDIAVLWGNSSVYKDLTEDMVVVFSAIVIQSGFSKRT